VRSIRLRLMFALLVTVALVCVIAAAVTYRRVLAESSVLFDYQLRQMALSLRSQITVAPRLELPPEAADTDFVVQIWDIFGTRVYLSRPGLPAINQVVLGYADLSLDGQGWRAYGLQTPDGVIQIAEPTGVRARLARNAAARVIVPLLLLLPMLFLAVAWIVRSSLAPLRRIAREVERRDEASLTPLPTDALPAEVSPLIAELNRLLARLAAAFRTQRAFISDAAHELRSPLAALRLQMQLLERAPDETARASALAQLGAAIERATHLVEQLLTLARSTPHDSPVQLHPVELGECVRAAIADTHPLAQSRGIELELDATVNCTVQGDEELLRTLARNLIDNAVRYTPRGGQVRVSVASAASEVELDVSDSGPGIPPEERTRVFDRFYRRAVSAESGTGLGLAIVQTIAARLCARVLLEDAAEGGLRVRVLFPATSVQPTP